MRTPGSLLALLIPLLACGCVGYASYLPEEETVEELEIAKGLTVPTLELTRDELLAHKGPPSEKRSDGDTEVWVYQGRRDVEGVILIAVVVPVPLLLPIGRERIEVAFRGDKAVSATVHTIGDHGALCGMLPGPCGVGPIGCDTR